MYLKCHLFLKVRILNNLKYFVNRSRGRNFSGEMKRKVDRERVPGSLAAGEDCRRERGVAGGVGDGGWSTSWEVGRLRQVKTRMILADLFTVHVKTGGRGINK